VCEHQQFFIKMRGKSATRSGKALGLIANKPEKARGGSQLFF